MKYDDIINIIKKAGLIINRNFNSDREIQCKGVANYVTDLDKKIEDYIINNILKIYPNDFVISEERNIDAKRKTYWVLDPIDGTTNLIHKYCSVAISLAHVINGNVVFGCVYNPIAHELFVATKGKGAYLLVNNQKHFLSVSTQKNISNSLIGFGFPYDKAKTNKILRIIKSIIETADDAKRLGPASLDICNVAAGRLDAYVELDLEKWDYFASKLILEEAGGKLSNFNNRTPNAKSNIVASNKSLHNSMINLIKHSN